MNPLANILKWAKTLFKERGKVMKKKVVVAVKKPAKKKAKKK